MIKQAYGREIIAVNEEAKINSMATGIFGNFDLAGYEIKDPPPAGKIVEIAQAQPDLCSLVTGRKGPGCVIQQ